MPIYEFSCEACGARFEELVPAGTDSAPCRECGMARTRRALSPIAAPFALVKSPGSRRRQERANEKLRRETKDRFVKARDRARARRGTGNGSAGPAGGQ